MKKLFYLASIAALAFSSCSKDDTTGAVVNTKSGGFTISASVVSDDATTRNYLGEVDGELAPLWSKTDVIAAFSDGTASEGVFHQNVPFAIDPFDAGQEDADFLNQENGLALLGGKNLLFYYPYNAKASLPEGLWNARDSKTGVATFNADKVDFLEIKAQQGYMDGSFISNMAPSVGTLPVSAVEVEDGTAVADVHLQPVVDYLVFKAVGTRPITKLELRLWGGPDGERDYLPIAGEGTLQSYVVDANKNGKADAGEATRYYWVPGEDATDVITLQPGTMTDAVCHEENTYVFVIPGGILGMGPAADVKAYIDIYDAEGNTMQVCLEGTQLNGAKVGTGASAVEYWRHIAESEDGPLVDPIMNMENHVFNANPINPNTGEREIFEFNPEGDVIIRDQIDLLQYFEEYQAALEDMQYAANPAVAGSTGEIEVEEDPRLKDAYICNNHAFDFSPEALGALATEYRNAGDEPKFNKYINKYHIYGFPCVDSYSNKFRGNGTEEHPTVISNVKLASMNGLFGIITSDANISGVTFENIAAAEKQVPVQQTRAAVETETRRGVILGIKALHKGVFGKGVKVVNPTAYAIVGFAKAGNYAAIELDGITSNLEHIFGVLEAEAGIDLSKTWAEASKVNGSIFEVIAPDSRKHTVFNVDNIASSAANYAKLTSKVLLKPYGDQKVVGVASVVLGGESWWTGGQIAASQAKATDPYLVKYAEQLANGQDEDAATYTYKLTCNMNLNWENLSDVEVNGVEYDDVPWVGDYYAIFNNFDGDNKTVKGVVMKSVDEFRADEYVDTKIAPFAFMNVKNLIVDGVDIDILTAHKDFVVPEFIAGLSKTAKNVDNVTVKNVKFNAHGKNSLNKGASYNDDVRRAVKAGWIISSAQDMKISNSTVENAESNIEALTAMVARVKLTKSNINAQFINNTVNMSTVSLYDEDMYAIEDFAKYDYALHMSAYSDIVAQVWVGDQAGEVGIKFNDFDSEPRFLVNIKPYNQYNNTLVVYLNNLAKYIFPKDFPVEE